jgi:hypothetical protein
MFMLLNFNNVGLTMNSLAAQAFVFYIGGFETSSTTMTFCLYELSLHQDIQERLRDEIDVVLKKHNGKLTYEAIQEMEYLDKVVSGKASLPLTNTSKCSEKGTQIANIVLIIITLSFPHAFIGVGRILFARILSPLY